MNHVGTAAPSRPAVGGVDRAWDRAKEAAGTQKRSRQNLDFGFGSEARFPANFRGLWVLAVVPMQLWERVRARGWRKCHGQVSSHVTGDSRWIFH